MFKVTEILKGSQGNIAYMNYVKDGGPADVMTAVGQILNHRINSIEDLVQCDGIIVEVVTDYDITSGETFATSTIQSDLSVLENVLTFIKNRHEADWGGEYRYRKLVIQF